MNLLLEASTFLPRLIGALFMYSFPGTVLAIGWKHGLW